MELIFSWQIFEKYSNTNRHKNPSSESLGSLDISYGRTDRWMDIHDEAKSLFRNIANAPKSNDKKVSREYWLDTLL